MRKYRQYGEDVWRGHIEKRARKGQSVRKYCEENGLNGSSFNRWSRLISRKSKGSGFIRLNTREEYPPRPELAITTPNGYRVEAANAEACIHAARSLAVC